MAKFRVWVEPESIKVSMVVDAKDEAEAEKLAYEYYDLGHFFESCGLRAHDLNYEVVGVDRDDVDEED